MHKAICTVCGQAYGGFAAHSLTKTEAKAATYTETGNNEYYTCSVCQKVFKLVHRKPLLKRRRLQS